VGCPGNSRAVILRSEATKDLRLPSSTNALAIVSVMRVIRP
jgi:hypothetical protein